MLAATAATGSRWRETARRTNSRSANTAASAVSNASTTNAWPSGVATATMAAPVSAAIVMSSQVSASNDDALRESWPPNFRSTYGVKTLAATVGNPT
jgi:hypothetical protein